MTAAGPPGRSRASCSTRRDARARGRPPPAAARPAASAPASRCCAGARRRPPATRAAAARYPDDVGADRRARHAHLPRGPRAHQRARRTRSPPRASRAGDGVAIMCRNHRGFVEALRRLLASSAPTRCSSTPRSPGPQLADVARARGRRGADLRRGVRASCSRRPAAAQALRRLARAGRGDRRRPARSSDLIDGGDRVRPVAAARAGQGRSILTSGTTGTPKGAPRSQPQSLDPVAALLERIPLRARETHDDRRAAVPLLGLRALHARAWGSRSTVVLQRKFDPEATLSLTAQHECDGARRRAGDAAAHPRARRRGARALRPVRAARGARLRLGAAGRARPTAGWTCSATTSTTSTARPRSRGRRSPRRRTCAPRPAPPAARRAARS